jgi:L-arabinonolactonase
MIVETAPSFELLPVARRDQLGEGPWWSVDDQYLYWVDIKGCLIRGARLDGSQEIEVSTPSEIGFVVPDKDRNLILGLRNGIFRREARTDRFELLTDPGHDAALQRINDGKTDRRGRVWFGTMHDQETEPVSDLYRLAHGESTSMASGIITSNGLGWSPDEAVMYYTDSLTRTITAYDFDAEEGTISESRTFVTDGPAWVPDGLTVDAEGYVWSAKWGGGRVIRYAPDGSIAQVIHLPVSRPTSCMFVGSDLRTLAVTSAQPAPGLNEPLAGAVFLIDVGIAGLPEAPAHLT